MPLSLRTAALALALALAAALARAAEVPGDRENGKLLLRQFGCGTCHRIPGVAVADGNVGPSLEKVGRRVYLAGFIPNTPRNMAAWIRDPRRFAPRTAMPDLQVSEPHARDMVAYLQSLE